MSAFFKKPRITINWKKNQEINSFIRLCFAKSLKGTIKQQLKCEFIRKLVKYIHIYKYIYKEASKSLTLFNLCTLNQK